MTANQTAARNCVPWVSAAETLIALALIAGFARKTTYRAAIVFSLLIWSTVEGFGPGRRPGAAHPGSRAAHRVTSTDRSPGAGETEKRRS